MVIIVGMLCFILAIPYLWCDPLITNPKRFSYQINDEKVTNYFTTLLSIIGTTFTAYYLRKQLKSAYAGIQPVLYPQRTKFVMEDFVTDERENIQKLPTVIWNKEGEGRFIEVYNQGNGTAKHIEFKWIYDTSEVIELIKNVYYYNNTDIENIPKENTTLASFVGKEKFAHLFLPHFYLKCCGPQLIKSNYTGTNFIPAAKRPSLELLITYKDIQDNKHIQKFNVDIWLMGKTITMDFRE